MSPASLPHPSPIFQNDGENTNERKIQTDTHHQKLHDTMGREPQTDPTITHATNKTTQTKNMPQGKVEIVMRDSQPIGDPAKLCQDLKTP
jgi:hypothetical protein